MVPAPPFLPAPTPTRGATAINAGTLAGGAANALSGSSALTVAAGAFLDLGGFDQAIGSLAGSRDRDQQRRPGAALTTGGDDTSTLFNGTIQDGVSTTALTKAGNGTLTLLGADTCTGGTTISAGTLQIGNDGTRARLPAMSQTTASSPSTLTNTVTLAATSPAPARSSRTAPAPPF